MKNNDEDRFRPKLGRIRSKGLSTSGNPSFFTKVHKIARQQGLAPGGRASAERVLGVRRGASSERSVGKGRGVKRGRGAAFVQSRSLGSGWSYRQPGIRRVVVKARSVRAAGKNGRGAAHLRYIQRDGTSRDGARGQLYSAIEDRTDGDAFLDRGKDDRHQFRFIVAPEDSTELADLTGFTRDLMNQLEKDLGTKLDWAAVNHFNTGHPHVHVIVNGRDDLGEDLVINGDYIAHGVRERASELATLELGPVTEIEQQRKLAAEIDQDRFTRIDRALIREASGGQLDVRHEPTNPHGASDRALPLARLGKLERLGLATESEPGRWSLSDRMETVLRELGERGDIIKTMHRALEAETRECDLASLQIHDDAPARPIIGKLIDKHLTDELGENLTLIVDGIDGRVHHIAGIDPAQVEETRIGGLVEIGPSEGTSRPADRAIASIAEDGVYRPSRHLEQARFESHAADRDYEGFIEAHVRRLEALRRAGVVERIDADHWRIPEDFEKQAAAYDTRRNRQAMVRTLSTFDLESQINADGATWIDRRLLKAGLSDMTDVGFGSEVRQAMDRRRELLIEQGDAVRAVDGRISYRSNLLAVLEQREVSRVGAQLASSNHLPFRAAVDGETVQGTFKQTIQLTSGKFALIENAREFTLVPWRPVIENHIGREVMGVVGGGTVSWEFGRKRGLGL
jgi:type IV secretory pathway VirD2 relaxase